jgi:hypothetical protein
MAPDAELTIRINGYLGFLRISRTLTVSRPYRERHLEPWEQEMFLPFFREEDRR